MGMSRREPDTIKAWQVGTSDVWVLPPRNSQSARIRIPMPPSVNVRQIPVMRYRQFTYGNGSTGRRAGMELKLTPEVVGYYQNALALRIAWKKVMERPIEDFVAMRFKFFLANEKYDTHNGLKVACDMIEKSGLVLNDRYILPQVLRPELAPGEPRLIIDFPVPAGTPPGSPQGTP